MTNSIDQQFIEFIVKSLVGNPDAVSIVRTIDEKGVLLELTVDAEDIGRVIGKRGATAQSLRTLLRALGTKNDARYNLKIVDVGFPEGRRNDENREPNQSQAEQRDSNQNQSETTDKISDKTPEETENQDTDTSDVVRNTRKELDELDDLDI